MFLDHGGTELLQPLQLILRQIHAGIDDDADASQRALGRHRFQQIKPGPVRQMQIHDQATKRLLPVCRQCLLAIGHRDDLRACGEQQRAVMLTLDVVVLDQQYRQRSIAGLRQLAQQLMQGLLFDRLGQIADRLLIPVQWLLHAGNDVHRQLAGLWPRAQLFQDLPTADVRQEQIQNHGIEPQSIQQ